MLNTALQLEDWPIGRLIEYDRNPRKNDDVVDRMAQAIVEFGFRIPIVARSDGLVVDGHLRLKAARLLGLATVPVVLADELSETQIRAFRLLANQSANWAEWDEALLSAELNDLLAEDFDLSLVGFSDGELDKLLAFVPEGDGLEGGAGGSVAPVTIPEPPRNPASRTGDLWTLAATNLAASMRRWRLTSAALVDSAAEQRSAGWACWRGNAAGLGGWTFVTRISLTTLQATGMGFFGLYGSTAALATTLTLAAAINCIGIGFQRGTHTRWQLVTNDGTGAPTLTDMGASFAIATGGVLTLYIAAPPNGSSVWVRLVDEVSGALFEQEITADLPANTQFLSPRLFINNGATAAAVAYDCSGVYVETDY